jgi:hypothetical protein
MPHLAHGAAARRDTRLLRIRKLSLWITGGAAAASLGLGAAFAHALPGHSHANAAPAGSGTSRSGVTDAPTGPREPGAGGRQATAHRIRIRTGHRRQAGLAPPRQQPAPAPAQTQPVVSSGGS